MNPRDILVNLRSAILGGKDPVPEQSSGNGDRNYKFVDLGFHGDRYLLDIVGSIAQDCRYFIETGANVGSTLVYVAGAYPHLECISCEPDTGAFIHVSKKAESLPNVKVFNETSQGFLRRLETEYQMLFSKKVLFWLDAHGYGFQWPLKEEIAFISTHFTNPYILIDDFKVPGLDCFGYDMYMDQECSFEYIRDSLNPDLYYNLHYPDYRERTSTHHPLQGWGLIEYGHGVLRLPDALEGKIKSYHHIQANG